MSFNAVITFLDTDADTSNAVVFALASESDISFNTTENSNVFSCDCNGALSQMLTAEDSFISTMSQFPKARAQLKISSFGYDRFSFIEFCGSQNICVRKHFSWYKGLVEIDGEDIEDLYQEWFSSTLDFCPEMPQDVLENELCFEQFVAACFFEY